MHMQWYDWLFLKYLHLGTVCSDWQLPFSYYSAGMNPAFFIS